MSVNKLVSVGAEQMRIIQLNEHFPTIFPSKFGVRIIQVCVLHSNFYGKHWAAGTSMYSGT